MTWHREYNETVREVAASRGWKLLDLARMVEEDPALVRVFKADGIHFTPDGLRWLAAQITASVRELL